MEEHQEELATIESIDSGAVYTLALKTHIGMSVQTFRYFAGWCDKIQASESVNHQLMVMLLYAFLFLFADILSKNSIDKINQEIQKIN